MAGVQNRLGSDFAGGSSFMSIAVDAERDAPGIVKRYAETNSPSTSA
jgi:cytochrome oxidase Cu insertion factor (SCO1/SenC/PrrC family)